MNSETILERFVHPYEVCHHIFYIYVYIFKMQQYYFNTKQRVLISLQKRLPCSKMEPHVNQKPFL